MASRQLQFIDPGIRLHAGASCLSRLGKELDRIGCARAVILCGRTMSQGPLIETLRDTLGNRLAGIFSEVRAHSPVPSVVAAATLLKQANADAVIALGGGSAVVTARAANIVFCEQQPPEALATRVGPDGKMISPRLDAPKLPVFAIPTTPSTAFVKAGSAVHNPETDQRLALFDPKTRSQALFIDPDMMMSAPQGLAVGSALDALSLAIEGVLSHRGNPLADAQLLHGIHMLVETLSRLPSEDGPDLRVELMLAAVLSGRGSDHTGAGIATVLGHALGAAFQVDNGMVKSTLMPQALRFNEAEGASGIAKLARALGVASGGAGGVIDALSTLYASLGIPSRLQDLGIPEAGLSEAAERGMDDWFLGGNPRPVTKPDELLSVLKAAW